MGDIVDNEEIDRDTVEPEVLEQSFSHKYTFVTETAVSLKKSYINHICGTKSLKLAVSQADNSIEVYELNKTSLSRVCRLSGHEKGLTGLVFGVDDHLIFSSGQDGLVKLWDTRTKGICVQEYKDEDPDVVRPYQCIDVSASGRAVCAGTELHLDDACLVFFDSRSPHPLGGYWNSHTDDVTQVKFHAEKPELLISGSLDGLLNVYNIMEETEDDALTYSLNIENSVEHLSWIDERRVACITSNNEVQLGDTVDGDILQTYSREKLTKAFQRSRPDDCYLVGAMAAEDGSPVILAGSYADETVLRTATLSGKRGLPHGLLRPNRQIVRCCYHHPESGMVVCGGEAGILSVWREETGTDSEPTASAPPRQRQRPHPHRHKPY